MTARDGGRHQEKESPRRADECATVFMKWRTKYLIKGTKIHKCRNTGSP
jgi:hypothetical protein